MSIDSLASRPRYQRSGKVRWGRLPFLLPIPLLVAVAMGAALCWTLIAGWYYPLFAVLLASLPLAAACFLTVGWLHCRSVTLAVLLGVASSTVMYLGYFHAHRIALEGPAVSVRLDGLPQFIAWRMQSDTKMNVFLRRAAKPDPVGNWLNFAIELGLMATIVGGLSAFRASEGYCESCGRWMRMGLQLAPPGSALAIGEYLAAGRLCELPAIANIGATAGKSSKIKVESCRRAGEAETCGSYLTLEEIDPGGLFGRSKSKKILTRGQISQEELGWLARSVPALAPLAPPGFAATAAATTAAGQSNQAVPAHAEAAVVETLPQEAADRIYTSTTILIASFLSLIPVVALLAGMGLLVAAWWFRPADLGDATRVASALSCLVIGGAATLLGATVCYVNLDYPGMQYVLSLTSSAIALRPDAIVNPSDPRAIWVEIVPRQRWTDIALDKSSDGGLLLVDEENRRLLFEGLRQRYRIPAAAIAHCEVESTMPDAGSFGFFATVVQARVSADSPAAGSGVASGLCEIPFMVRPATFTRFSGAYRRRSCEELAELIRRIRA